MKQATVKDLIEYLKTLPEDMLVEECNPAKCKPLDKKNIGSVFWIVKDEVNNILCIGM